MNEDDIKQMIQERIKQALGQQQQSAGTPLGSLVFQPGAGVFQQMGGGVMPADAMQAAPAEESMTPEDYEYFVEIAKRDVLDPEGESIGWNKTVHRYRKPSLSDLTDEGLKEQDQSKKKKTLSEMMIGQGYYG